MKKTLSVILAFAMALSVGCSKNSDSFSQSGPAAAEPLQASQLNYKVTDIPTPDDLESPLGLDWHNGLRLVYENSSGGAAIQTYTDDITLSKVIPLAENEDDLNCLSDRIICVKPDGTIAVVYQYIEYDGDIGDTENYFKDAVVSFRLAIYDENGSLLDENNISGIEDFYSLGSSFIEGLYSCGDSYILRNNYGYAFISNKGEVFDEIMDNDGRYSFAACTDGSVIAAAWDEWGYMDTETMKFPSSAREYGKWLTSLGGVFPGGGDYKAFLALNKGIYGVGNDDTLTWLVGYSESEFAAGMVFSASYAGEDRFAMITYDQTGSGGIMFNLLTRRPDGYTDERTPVVIGCINWDNNADDTVVLYNKQSDSYIAETKKYNNYDDLKLDVLSGEQPDLFCYRESAFMYRYANLGAFADLNTLMDERNGLSRDDIVPGLLKAYEYKGGLYGLPVAFDYKLWIANSDVVSRDYSQWSVSDFLSIAEELPDGMYLGSRNSPFTGRDIAWQNFFSDMLFNYVDYNNYTCSFDSPEFVRLLEYLGTFEVNEPYDYDNADQKTQDLYFSESNAALSEKKALLGYSWMHSFDQILMCPAQYSLLENDNYTYLISPSNDGRGRICTVNCMCYSILNKASNPDGAWDYFCYIMGEKYQTSYLQTQFSFTSNLSAYTKNMNKAMDEFATTLYWYNGGRSIEPENFTEVDGELVYTGDTTEKYAHPLDEENREYILSVLDSCDVLMDSDEQIFSIADEEVGKYLAGEQSAQQCADLIQNRVSLYLGESG